MEKENVWGKIRKTVTEGVAVAAEKTEEYTRLGKAKLNMLSVKRHITRKRTELGGVVYTAVKEGKAEGLFTTDQVKSLVKELNGLDAELAKLQKQYNELKRKAESDVAAVKKKAKSGMEDITTRAKSTVKEIKKKAQKKAAGTENTKTAGEKKE